MNANTETIRQKLAIIDENKQYLAEESEFDPETAAFGERQAVKHCMFEIAEACIDIAAHIIASEGFEQPDDYAGLFPVLARHDIIDDQLAADLADMARFRNVLVHRYGDIEPAKLHRFIDNDLADVETFASAIYRYMDDQG